MDVGPLARLRNNIRESNRAWVVCFIGIIAIGGLLVVLTSQQEQLVEVIQPNPPHNEHGTYTDTAHRKFVDEFKYHMGKRGIQVDSEWENSGRFRITTTPDTSQDDIIFMSSAAARAILHRFRNAPYVYVYTQNTGTSSLPKLVYETSWVPRRGDFDIRPVAPSTQLPTRREP